VRSKRFTDIKDQGFTLVELVIVVALFGLLMVAASSFLISVLSGGNRVSVENEVRQNAVGIMRDLGAEVRASSSSYSCTDGNGTVYFWLGNSGMCDPVGCSSSSCPRARVVYTANKSTGVVTKEIVGVTALPAPAINSAKVKVIDCGGASACSGNSNACSAGLGVSLSGGGAYAQEEPGPIEVILTVRQAVDTTRQDSCVVLPLAETLMPRNGQ